MKIMAVQPGQLALDVCCGTGDWTIALANTVGAGGYVSGLDLSPQMLKVADQKITTHHLTGQIGLHHGDAMHLPYPDNTFNVVTIGFGLRNVPDAQQVLREMTRVVKPGGQVVCLETAQPQNRLVHAGWQAYFGHVVPLMGRVIAHHYQAYNYLQRTTHEFISVTALADLFSQVGLEQIQVRRFNFGAAAMHRGIKPY